MFILFFPRVLSENDRPTSLVPDLIDYNMPLTATYLKQMKLQCRTSTERVRRVRVRAGPTRVLTAHPIRASPQMRPALHRNSISIDSRSDYWLLGGSWPQGERVTFDLVLETEGSPLIVWEEELRGGLGNVLFGGVTSRTRPLPTGERGRKSQRVCVGGVRPVFPDDADRAQPSGVVGIIWTQTGTRG